MELETYEDIKDVLEQIENEEECEYSFDDIEEAITNLYEEGVISEEEHDELYEILEDLR